MAPQTTLTATHHLPSQSGASRRVCQWQPALWSLLAAEATGIHASILHTRAEEPLWMDRRSLSARLTTSAAPSWCRPSLACARPTIGPDASVTLDWLQLARERASMPVALQPCPAWQSAAAGIFLIHAKGAAHIPHKDLVHVYWACMRHATVCWHHCLTLPTCISAVWGKAVQVKADTPKL